MSWGESMTHLRLRWKADLCDRIFAAGEQWVSKDAGAKGRWLCNRLGIGSPPDELIDLLSCLIEMIENPKQSDYDGPTTHDTLGER